MTIQAGTIHSDGRTLVPESGLVIVAKSAGMTSHDVVARIRRLAGTKRVGHAGTLDPMATGVLVIGIEKATRLLGHLALTEKEYMATIRLGQSTVTDDADGEVLPLAASVVRASDVSQESLRTALAGLTGEIEQVPPKVSAIKVNGQRAYHLTRAGAAPELKARTVTVWRLDLLAVRPAGDLLDVDVDVTCSSGTYIRAIARDLGAALGTGGHLSALRRTRVGPYTIDAARTLDQLAEHFEYIPLTKAAAEAFPAIRLDERETWLLSHGVRLAAPWRAAIGREPVALGSEGTMAHSTDPNLVGRTPIAAFGPDGSLIALVAEQHGELQPLAVFVP
jgi:tRNA pseudouridine55 synthase